MTVNAGGIAMNVMLFDMNHLFELLCSRRLGKSMDREFIIKAETTTWFTALIQEGIIFDCDQI